MEKKTLLNKALEVKTTKRANGDECVHQTQGREIKETILKELNELVAATYDMDCVRTDEGIIMLIQNDNLGVIPVALDVKVKSLDYDYDTAATDYTQKLKDRADKKAKKEATANK